MQTIGEWTLCVGAFIEFDGYILWLVIPHCMSWVSRVGITQDWRSWRRRRLRLWKKPAEDFIPSAQYPADFGGCPNPNPAVFFFPVDLCPNPPSCRILLSSSTVDHPPSCIYCSWVKPCHNPHPPIFCALLKPCPNPILGYSALW